MLWKKSCLVCDASHFDDSYASTGHNGKKQGFLPIGFEGQAQKNFFCSAISGMCQLWTNELLGPLSSRRKHAVQCRVEEEKEKLKEYKKDNSVLSKCSVLSIERQMFTEFFTVFYWLIITAVAGKDFLVFQLYVPKIATPIPMEASKDLTKRTHYWRHGFQTKSCVKTPTFVPRYGSYL